MKYIKMWLFIGRGFALPQCIMPGVMAVILSLGLKDAQGNPLGDFNLALAILAVFACCLVHLANNMLDDYFDYKYDILDYRLDLRKEGEQAFTDKYPYLLDGTITHRQLGWAIVGFLGAAALIGAVIFLYRGWNVVWIALAVLILGYSYSGKPLKLGFHGLGELIIGLCFGPCLMCGVFESASGALYTPENGIYWPIVYMSIAIGMFVTNILYTHSFVERHIDAVSHKKTLAVLLKYDWAGLLAYAILLYVPFLLVVLAVYVGYIHWAYLLTLVMLPQTFWLMNSMVRYAKKQPVDTANPPKWLGPMDNLEEHVRNNNDYYIVRWYTMRNINTGFCLIVAVVKLVLLFL